MIPELVPVIPACSMLPGLAPAKQESAETKSDRRRGAPDLRGDAFAAQVSPNATRSPRELEPP